MSTVQIAKECKQAFDAFDIEACREWFRENPETTDYDSGDVYAHIEDRVIVIASLYIGSVFALDPCGRYHHLLSPNGYTSRCGAFWESLERQLEQRGLWLESGEGDPCDQFARMAFDLEVNE